MFAKTKRHYLKKILQVTIVSLTVVSLNAPVAYALLGDTFDIPSVQEVAHDLEQRYHINASSVRDLMRGFNVSDQKTSAPEVILTFSPQNPKEGEEVTAMANPMFFKTDKERLYYTWYIVHAAEDAPKPDYDGDGKGCKITTTPGGRDEVDDIDDCKREAARILASNYFDTTDPTVSYSPGGSDDDEDGYAAYYGGEGAPKRTYESKRHGKAPTNEGKPYNKGDYCYVRDFRTGYDFELARVANEGSGDWEDAVDMGLDDIGDTESGLAAEGRTIGLDNDGLLYGFDADEAASSDDSTAGLDIAAAGLKLESGCRHLFASYPGGSEITGDGSFPNREEEFWQTNPKDPDTGDRGVSDEAVIVGLGQDKFTWVYRKGDLVGVAVEGESMIPTKHKDSGYQIMWALAKNKCHELEREVEIKHAERDTWDRRGITKYRLWVENYPFNIRAAEPSVFQINSCLDDNLVDPQEQSVVNLKPILSYIPENPRNDPTNDPKTNTGDFLLIQSVVPGAEQKRTDLVYEWEVKRYEPLGTGAYSDIEEDHWDNLTDKIKDHGSGPTSGINIDNLGFRLDFSGWRDIEYLRVKLTVSENSSNVEERKGVSVIIIKVITSDDGIRAYYVGEDNISGSSNHLSLGDEMCTEGLERLNCPVTKYSIVGLEMDIDTPSAHKFSWTINGKTFAPTECYYDGCTPEIINQYAYFPVLGEPGETYTVKATALDDRNGNTIEFTRTFQVVDPYVELSCTDGGCEKKLIGQYTDLNGTTTDNYSEMVMQTGGNFTVTADFKPDSIDDYVVDPLWYADGVLVTDSNKAELGVEWGDAERHSLAVTNQKGPGGAYNITVSATVRKNVEIKQAIANIWNANILNFFMEDNINGGLQVEMADTAATASAGKATGVLASVFSHLPGQIIFLFRILLTIAVILFTASLVFFLTPQYGRRL